MASSHRQQLTRAATSLQAMLAELPGRSMSEGVRGWREPVVAARTVGDAPISHWALAEHFMLTWAEWTQVCRRYSTYYGHGVPAMQTAFALMRMSPFPGLPAGWNSINMLCQGCKDSFSRSRELAEIWDEAWGLSDSKTFEVEPGDVRGWCIRFIESYERLRMLSVLGKDADESWAELRDRVMVWDDVLRGDFIEADPATQEQVLGHLRRYRHATLDAPWLSFKAGEDSDPSEGPDRSSVREMTSEKYSAAEWSGQALERFGLEGRMREEARRVLRRLGEGVWEFGFSPVTEDLHERELRPSSLGPVGSPIVLLNPRPGTTRSGQEKKRRGTVVHLGLFAGGPVWKDGREASDLELGQITVTSARSGGRGWIETTRRLGDLVGYLAEAERLPDLCIVMSEAWDSSAFERQWRDVLRPFQAKGVQFLFLLAGVPDRRLTALDVAL